MSRLAGQGFWRIAPALVRMPSTFRNPVVTGHAVIMTRSHRCKPSHPGWGHLRSASVDNVGAVGVSVPWRQELHVFDQSGQQLVVIGLDLGHAGLLDLVTLLVGE
jgi:hypothetical protein